MCHSHAVVATPRLAARRWEGGVMCIPGRADGGRRTVVVLSEGRPANRATRGRSRWRSALRQGADLPGASDAPLADARLMEGAHGAVGAQDDVPGADGRGGEAALDALRPGRRGGSTAHRQELALGVGPGRPVLRVLRPDPAGGLHHQRNREPERHGPARRQGARPLPQRSRRGKARVPGAVQRRGQVAQPADLLACPRTEFSIRLDDRFRLLE